MDVGKEIATFIGRLDNLLRAEQRLEGGAEGLLPVHIQMLTYLSICNRYSDTPQSVGEFVGATKGTTSQSINVLERKGFLKKSHDKKDKRVVHLKLTAWGKRLVERAAVPKLVGDALSEMSEKDRTNLSGLLKTLLVGMQRLNRGYQFGVCKTCNYFRRKGLGDTHQCGLTKEALTDADSMLLCREHEDPAGV